MRIAKNELLAGIPVLKIRDYFRLLYSGLMTRDGLAERFNLNEKETEGLVGELLSKGYIEPADNGMYRLTLKVLILEHLIFRSGKKAKKE